MFNLTARRSIQAALVAAIALVGSRIAAGDERPSRKSATELRRVLDWFPEDIETLVVAQSFSIPKRSDTPKAAKGAAAFLSSLALGELEDDKHIGPLAGRKVLIAVNGMRLPRVTSKFGEFYAEGCSIIVFDRDLGQAAVDWTNALRKEAKEIRKIAGREVLCFRSKEIKAWKGPGIYFVKLRRIRSCARPTTSSCNSSSNASTRHRTGAHPPAPFPTVFRNGRQSTGWPPSG